MDPIALVITLALASAAADEDKISAALKRIIPGAASRQILIQPSPMPGLSEAVVGGRVVYVSDDGRFLLAGPLYALGGGRNLTEERQGTLRKQLLAAPGTASRVRYPSAVPRHVVTVVTNVDCPYCRQLHSQLSDYDELGISLEYVMTPFGGAGSAGYRKTAELLCAADPAAAITAAMNGAEPLVASAPADGCDKLLDRHMALARELGAATTPNLILPDGRLIAGYKTPQQLLQLLSAQNP